ncbi:hypothetical protein DPMN_030259 [Dreissena polymorpha]|uniref:Uncharacterized protein n=1 Tax=Dreissena polymorpha TaxID=45954 RepID=A0A9D4RGY5_DREPO|nr:hypothetical protein DPMN_030259 [Dreissena polymorpha]
MKGETASETGAITCSIFIYFKNSFNRVLHQCLWRVLYHFGIYLKLIGLMVILYKRTQSVIRVGRDVADWFLLEIGVRQCCILSPDFSTSILSISCRLHSKDLTIRKLV